MLDCIEIETAEYIEYSVIWLHGLGASGHDFEPLVPELRLLHRPGIRFLFPHAPVRPITVNGGAAMRAWYDISSIDFEERQQDSAGIHSSAAAVMELVDNEIKRGIPSRQIVLAGFSQGGAIALYAGLTTDYHLGGIVALSTYLPLQAEVLPTLGEKRLCFEVFMAHGLHDDVILYRYGEQSRSTLEASGVKLEWHAYPMAHSVCAEQVRDLSIWFRRLFGM